MKRVQKGCYGYLAFQKKWSIIRTVFFFVLSAAILGMGYLTTKTRVNPLTVVAVLGMLPASRSMVNMIMFLKNRGCSEEAYTQISGHTSGLTVFYDLVMTSYDKTYSISSIAVKGHNICGFSEDAKMQESDAEKHIAEKLQFAGLKGYSVKIFKNPDKYTERLEQMQALETEESKKQEEAALNLLAISL